MKRIVCGCFGTIYYAQILKSGLMSSNNRIDVTDDAIDSVLNHIMLTDCYTEKGYGGYEFNVGNVPVRLTAYDSRKYKLVKIDDEVTDEMN